MASLSPLTCHGPKLCSRREMLQLGGSLVLGLNLAGLLRRGSSRQGVIEAVSWADRSEVSRALSPTADACILVFLDGGPSHLDMWDMKPDAPAGDPRRVPADRHAACRRSVCEHLPGFSRQIHRGTLIRSAHHSVNNSHGAAVYTA